VTIPDAMATAILASVKHCLNTEIAACRVQIKDRSVSIQETLETRSRAAFEILTDDRTHGIPMAA
jgi:hypothetical protein